MTGNEKMDLIIATLLEASSRNNILISCPFIQQCNFLLHILSEYLLTRVPTPTLMSHLDKGKSSCPWFTRLSKSLLKFCNVSVFLKGQDLDTGQLWTPMQARDGVFALPDNLPSSKAHSQIKAVSLRQTGMIACVHKELS